MQTYAYVGQNLINASTLEVLIIIKVKKYGWKKMRVTVKDLAKVSGYSQPTVSRALNDSKY